MSTNYQKFKGTKTGGFFRNPFFSFGVISLILFVMLIMSADNLAIASFKNSDNLVLVAPVNDTAKGSDDNSLFVNQNESTSLETPDLKIVQDSFVYGISTPLILTTQTLGSIFGGSSQDKKDITEYVVELGDTSQSVADAFNVSLNTILWANNLSKNSTLKVDQTLVILPVSGLVHVVKSGDTISDLARMYKAKAEEIVDSNGLASEGDIFIGDLLIIPNGIMPVKVAPLNPQTQLADSFFIIPAEGIITQGLHWYNAVDLANKCGTPIYAAANGTVQRVRYGWNGGGGNYITILHFSGVVSYYGHLMSDFVKPGDQVNVGDRIGLMGQTGKTTGCHVHFEVIGAKNPLAKYSVGTPLKYKQ